MAPVLEIPNGYVFKSEQQLFGIFGVQSVSFVGQNDSHVGEQTFDVCRCEVNLGQLSKFLSFKMLQVFHLHVASGTFGKSIYLSSFLTLDNMLSDKMPWSIERASGMRKKVYFVLRVEQGHHKVVFIIFHG